MTRALLSDPQTAARVDVAPPEIIHVTGDDRVAFLHRMLTNNVQTIAVGHGRPAMLLTAKGQVVSLMQVLVDAEKVTLVVPGGTGNAVSDALSRFAVMDDVNFAVPPMVSLTMVGPRALEAFRTAGVAVPAGLAEAEPLTHASFDGVLHLKISALGTVGLSLFGTAGVIAAVSEKLDVSGVPRLSADETESARIAAGEPRHGLEYCGEIAGERFPMEVGLEGAIDYGKGCYPGQEPIVRIRDRGKVNWRLGRLRFAPGATRPVPGAALSTPERESAGRVTSSGLWQPPGAAAPYPIALALLHASVLDGASVDVATDGGHVTAQVLQPGDPA